MDRRPKRIQQLIRRDSGVLGKLVDENDRRAALNNVLEGFLDRPFSEHVQVASVRGMRKIPADQRTVGIRAHATAPGASSRRRATAFV